MTPAVYQWAVRHGVTAQALAELQAVFGMQGGHDMPPDTKGISEAAVQAAENGHLDCLKYIFEHGCTPSIRITAAAAKEGHVECLKYAHKQGCPMNKVTMHSTKSLDCIKYMHEQRVNWDVSMYDSALTDNRLDCIQYFHEQGLPCAQFIAPMSPS